ncbi:MAG: NAD(P)-binding protein [Pseudomonadota bacterium]
MSRRKQRLGEGVTRRDVIHGLGALGAGALVPGITLADRVLAMESQASAGYPPALTGMRGNHAGSFEVAHALARHGQTEWGKPQPVDDEYDLIVVGAGISGLAAAWFYRREHPDARILLLDNHDDFGGHAKRNEFSIDGQTLIGYGGSQTMESPYDYPKTASALLEALGINLEKFDTAYDSGFYRRHGLGAGIFFNEAQWGSNRLVKYDLGPLSSFIPLAPATLDAAAAAAQMPISSKAQQQMARLLTTETNQLTHLPASQREDYLYSITYEAFLAQHLGVSEPEVLAVLQDLAGDSGVGIETVSAGSAILYSGMPGYEAAGLPPWGDDDPYIHHYPDGNATVARRLVQELIPAVALSGNVEDLVTTRFDYAKLDEPDASVKLRLSSTVVNVANRGSDDKGVLVTYVRNGKPYRVAGKGCVLACYNSIIPSICPELPSQQREALALQVKSPILYTNVALKNWHAWKNLGLGAAVAPGSYHMLAKLDFPVSMGDYRFTADPEQPIVVHMERFPYPARSDMSKREQLRWGRHQLLATPYQEIENQVVEQLSGMLGEGGFVAERDIAAITVNRWAHGYSYFYNFHEDPWYEDWDDPRYPHVQARQTHGRIAIANSDAAASAMMETAIVEAHRAVEELIS